MARALGFVLAAALFAAAPVYAGEAATQVLAAVNLARSAAGCGALTLNPKLTAAAKAHARAMAERNFFGHTGKDGSRFTARIKRQGYRYSAAAENIAAGQSSVARVMQDWLASAPHRNNMLDCGLSETGIAVTYQPDDKPIKGRKYPLKYYWVEVFAAP